MALNKFALNDSDLDKVTGGAITVDTGYGTLDVTAAQIHDALETRSFLIAAVIGYVMAHPETKTAIENEYYNVGGYTTPKLPWDEPSAWPEYASYFA